MKILSLPSIKEKIKLSSGIFTEQIDKNDVYEVNLYYLSSGSEFKVGKNDFTTYYLLEGSVNVTLFNEEEKIIATKTFQAHHGWLLLPVQSQIVKADAESKIFVVKNSTPLSAKDIAERGKKIVLDGEVFNELSDYLVNKPWGSEQWFVDTGIYVLKGIKMKSGYECSLQLHEHKIEVNLLISGKAQLILNQNEEINTAIAKHYQNGGTQVDFSLPGEEVAALKNNIKPIVINPGEGWKTNIFDIHQVLSLDTYYALEVSTSEVDDIIRLKDLYNRPGGKIESEHAKQ